MYVSIKFMDVDYIGKLVKRYRHKTQIEAYDVDSNRRNQADRIGRRALVHLSKGNKSFLVKAGKTLLFNPVPEAEVYPLVAENLRPYSIDFIVVRTGVIVDPIHIEGSRDVLTITSIDGEETHAKMHEEVTKEVSGRITTQVYPPVDGATSLV